MKKNNKIFDTIIYLSFIFITIASILMTIYSKTEINKFYKNGNTPPKQYFTFYNFFLWCLIILILIETIYLIYTILKHIKNKKIYKRNSENNKNTSNNKIDIQHKIDIKYIIFYISILTLIILAILSIIFGFLLTIMPIPQILLILNIVLTTILNKNIQNEKLINAIKQNNKYLDKDSEH